MSKNLQSNVEHYFLRHKKRAASTSAATSTATATVEGLQETVRVNSHSVMAPPAPLTLEDIAQKLDCLATKEDLKGLTDKLSERLKEVEDKVDAIDLDMGGLKKEIQEVRVQNAHLKQKMQKLERKYEKTTNEQEQYSRRWNLRVFGIKEGSSEDCTEKCLAVFNDKVRVETKPDDIQVAHRVGNLTGPDGEKPRRPRPIIVQFSSRRVRDKVLANRKTLAGSGVSIAEDLTVKNFKLLKTVQDHSATMTAWPANGRIIALLKNGKKVRVDHDHDNDLDSFFAEKMNE